MRSLRRFSVDDQNVQRALDAIREWAKQLEGIPMLDGALVEDIVFGGAGTSLVTHRLGRVPRGARVEKWIQASAGDPPRLAAIPDKDVLTVAVSAACVVSFWVW